MYTCLFADNGGQCIRKWSAIMNYQSDNNLKDSVFYETYYLDGEKVRVYETEDGWQSAVYVEKNRHFDLVFEYTKKFDLLFDLKEDLSRILLVGGAGFSYPKHVLSSRRNTEMTVIDLDPTVYDTAMNYFYLDELFLKYPDAQDRLRFINAEGRDWLETHDEVFEAIIHDAYDGFMPAITLLTKEACETVKKHLTPDGIYTVNLPGHFSLAGSEFMLNCLHTLRQVFAHVLLVRAPAPGASENTNYVAFASDCYAQIAGMMHYDDARARVYHDKNIDAVRENYAW